MTRPSEQGIPILGQKPPQLQAAANGLNIQVTAAMGTGSTRQRADDAAMIALHMGAFNLVQITRPLLLLPHRTMVEAYEDAAMSKVAALSVESPDHPLWGVKLQALVAREQSTDPDTTAAACIGWVQIINPGAPGVALGGFMAVGTAVDRDEQHAHDRAEARMEEIISAATLARGLPVPPTIHRVTITAVPLEEGIAASATVIAAAAIEIW